MQLRKFELLCPIPLCWFPLVSENPSEVFVVQFSPDGQFIAAGCNDGEVRVRAVP
jgi:WD40 repeat protein